jgi:hypothetical protein
MYKKITTIEEMFGDHHYHKKKKYHNTVWLDVPLMVRLMEYAKEEAADDVELHAIVERMFDMCCDEKPLMMEDYVKIIAKSETPEA